MRTAIINSFTTAAQGETSMFDERRFFTKHGLTLSLSVWYSSCSVFRSSAQCSAHDLSEPCGINFLKLCWQSQRIVVLVFHCVNLNYGKVLMKYLYELALSITTCNGKLNVRKCCNELFFLNKPHGFIQVYNTFNICFAIQSYESY